jgi:hypothetical protein
MLSRRNPMRMVLLSVLIFEAIAFLLAIPVMIFVSEVGAGMAGAVSGGVAVLAVVSAGLMRKPVGYLLGWVTQVAGVALGFLTPAMFVVGLLFLGLWVLGVVLGRKLDAQATAGRVNSPR